MERTDSGVDVPPVRASSDRHDVSAEIPKELWRQPVRGAVRAVENDLHPSKASERNNATEKGEVVALSLSSQLQGPDSFASWPWRAVLLSEPPLKFFLPGIGEFRSAGTEELDPIVLKRVVRGGDYDSAVRQILFSEKRNGRSRHHPNVDALPPR